MKQAEEKLLVLEQILLKLECVAVAFSGGVDSALLLAAAHKVLGSNAIAVTAVSRVIPKREQDEAKEFCLARGINQQIYEFDELQVEGFRTNPVDRCYHCKHALFTGLMDKAKKLGCCTLVEGSNMDDMGDYRPGLRALQELKVISPLKEAGLTKEEIRLLAKKLGLSEWNKPSYACLASRFAYGQEITAEGLARVEAAEDLLYKLGLRQFRVRVHGEMARIEVLPEEMSVILENRLAIDSQLKDLGFAYIALDLKGYTSGSMNIGLEK